MWNPLVHVIMWFRSGIYPQYRAAGMDIGYVSVVVTVIVMVRLALFTMSRSLREDRI